MTAQKKLYYEKRAGVLVKNLRSRHFDAHYCATKEEALEKALSLIPKGASVGWGGAMSAHQIGLMDAVRKGDYRAIDRDLGQTREQQQQAMRDAMTADVFITGANALSLDGQMVQAIGWALSFTGPSLCW